MARITIVLGHYKRTGKDSFADYLIDCVHERGQAIKIGKRSVAYKLKEIAHDLYGWAGLQGPEFYETVAGEKLREVVLPLLGKSPRQIWIDLGTTAVRDQVYRDTWLKWFIHNPSDNDVDIIADMRFPNEAEEFGDLPGIHFIKMVRPGYGPTNKPDKALVGWNGWQNVIGSSGDMKEIRMAAANYAHAICTGQNFDRFMISDKQRALAESVEVFDG